MAPEQFEDAPVQIEQNESESVSIRVESATGYGNNPMAPEEDQEGPPTEQDTQEEDREAP